MLNHTDLMGRLTRDPELRYTQSGTPVTAFTLANDTGRKRDDGSRITHFIDCVAWRKTAEFAAKYLTKGRLVVVEGEIETRSYEKDGVKRKVVEINVKSIHFADSKKDAGASPDSEAPADGFTEVDDDGDLPF
jgi:single-strand DNA-binding protein